MIATFFATLLLTAPLTAHAEFGSAIEGISRDELTYFNSGWRRFDEVDSVSGTEPGTTGSGLGPRFNMNSCVACHAYPAGGGTSPVLNPLFDVATRYGARNKVPYFLRQNGPIREARFRYKADGTRDGSVHNNFVIAGRQDAGRCNIQQPDFDLEGRHGNLSFRIPTPLFGLGLIQEISDGSILANKNSFQVEKRALGIHGHENRSGNDATITRFGWKAQNKSLEIFAGEAYNVEQGVTNELFPNERDDTPGCELNATPEDHIDVNTQTMSDIEGFTQFMRFLAPPPVSGIMSDSAKRGATQFSNVGCMYCHTPTLTTGSASSAALSLKPVNLYSDLLVHHMGSTLADEIVQGQAGPDEFRTAPLWGVGHRLFFLHDGRTSDLREAIEAHSGKRRGRGGDMPGFDAVYSSSSEADKVIMNYDRLSESEKSDLVEFLKSI